MTEMPVLWMWRWCRGVRYSFARWLLRPEAARIIGHYSRLANDENCPTGRECAYISIGTQYVANGWPNRPWQEVPPFDALNVEKPDHDSTSGVVEGAQ